MDNGDTQNFGLDQFNLDTTSENWGNQTPGNPGNNQATSPEHDQRALGNIAISTPEADPSISPDMLPQPGTTPDIFPASTTPELGQITPSTTPNFTAPGLEDPLKNQPATDIHTDTIIKKVQNGGNLTSAEAKFIETDFNNTELADAYDRYRPEPEQELGS